MRRKVTFTVTLMMKAKNEQRAVAIARSILGQRLEDAVEGEPESDGTELRGFEITHTRTRDRAADFFNALRGPDADYDIAILTFEKLVAEYAPSAIGQDVLEIMERAYSSAKARGSLGALINRDGELWKGGEQ